MSKNPEYEQPKVSRLDGNKSVIGGDVGPCEPAGSSAVTLCADGNSASGADACLTGLAPVEIP